MSITEARTYELTPAIRQRRAWMASEELRSKLDQDQRDWVTPESMSRCALIFSVSGHMGLGLHLTHLGQARNEAWLHKAYGKVADTLWSYYPEVFAEPGSPLASDIPDPNPDHERAKGAGLLKLLKVTG